MKRAQCFSFGRKIQSVELLGNWELVVRDIDNTSVNRYIIKKER